MTKILALLSSLKLAVILLVLLLLGLAAGTIIESQAGVAIAGRLVYFAPWFLGLQALFVVNLVASIVTLFPWGSPRIGYLVTHSSMVLILLGALVTFFFKTEGQIGLWEGTAGNTIDQVEGEQLVARHDAPLLDSPRRLPARALPGDDAALPVPQPGRHHRHRDGQDHPGRGLDEPPARA